MSDITVIRRAAKELRARAEAAAPGPWIPTGYGDYGPGVDFTGSRSTFGDGVECADTEEGWATCDYLALVSPEVGLAVADWLDDAPSRRDFSRATRVAQAILTSARHDTSA